MTEGKTEIQAKMCPICAAPIISTGLHHIAYKCYKCKKGLLNIGNQWLPVIQFLDPKNKLQLSDEEGFSEDYNQLLKREREFEQDQMTRQAQGDWATPYRNDFLWTALARRCMSTFDGDEALACLIHELEICPWHPLIWFFLSQVLITLKFIDQGEKAIEIYRHYDDDPQNLSQLNGMLHQMKMVMRNAPPRTEQEGYADALVDLGKMNISNQKFPRGLKRLKAAFELDPCAQNRMYLANLYNHLGEYKEAINFYLQVLMKHPQDFYVTYMTAMAYAEMGDIKPAIKYFEKALKIKPADPMAKIRLQQLKKDGHFTEMDFNRIPECRKWKEEMNQDAMRRR